MKNNLSNNPTVDKIWQFIRGDMLTADFEQWIYTDPAVEEMLGEDLYFEVASISFSSKDAVFQIKKILKKFAISVTNTSCLCPQLSNIAVVNMGEESEKVFHTIDQIQKRGDPYWWLSVDQCNECHQSWLVAQEERQNDVYCMYRLDEAEMNDLLKNDNWPDVFNLYEDLIRTGIRAGKIVRFDDPLISMSLPWTMADIARDRPGIKTSELAELLNLDISIAIKLARKVVREEGVNIVFDDLK